MIKRELKALEDLKATPEMMDLAKRDKKERREYTRWGGRYTSSEYKYCIYMRCRVQLGYLKVGYFMGSHMRCGGDKPIYELYCHRESGQFLTWDCQNQKWRESMEDNLEWPQQYWRSKVWISEEDEKTVQEYLKLPNETAWDGIIRWQRRMREEQLERRYKRQVDPWDRELAQTPALPKDWKKWCNKVAVPENYIFYDYIRSGAKDGYCTYCDKVVPIEKPVHGKKDKCRCCGREITFKSRNRQKYIHTERHYAYLIQRTENGFVVREFWAMRTYRQDEGWKANVINHELRRAFFDQTSKPVSAYVWDLYRNKEHRFVSTGVCALSWGGADRGAVYGRTLPDLAQKELKHTGLLEYLQSEPKVDAEWYLTTWNRYPQLEQLVKANLPKLVTDFMCNINLLDGAYKKRVSGGLARKLGTDDQGLRRMRENNGGVTFLNWLQFEKKTGKRLENSTIQYLAENHATPESLSFISDRMSIVQICNYIQKQSGISGMGYGHTITTWRDYLNMAKKHGKDLSDPYVYKPARLKQRHDELVLQNMMQDLQKAAKKTAMDFPKVEPVLQSIREIYSYTGEKYSVVVPDGILDIMVEGKALNHCVGSSTRYLERMERQESYILFLRKTEALKQAYYTLEVEPDGTVRQKRTQDDEQRPDIKEAKKFLQQWQKEVAKRLTDTERTLAKKSKELRLEGFAQMRRDQVRIHTGKLQGRMLVDVLMADLMENNEEDKTA